MDQRDDDMPGLWRPGPADHNLVAIVDPGISHRLAGYPHHVRRGRLLDQPATEVDRFFQIVCGRARETSRRIYQQQPDLVRDEL